jgi:hypothetical protein
MGYRRAVWRGAGAVDAGVIPALVYLSERAPSGEGEPPAAGSKLPCRVPLLPGKDVLAFIDIDSQQNVVYGQEAGCAV